MAEQSRELAKYERRATEVAVPGLPPLEIPQPPLAPEVIAETESAFAARGRVRWTPRRVRRMVPSKLKEVVVAILGALEDPPRRGAARRRRLPAPAQPLPFHGGSPPGVGPAADSVGGATREGAD